jgi:hypothetical protein
VSSECSLGLRDVAAAREDWAETKLTRLIGHQIVATIAQSELGLRLNSYCYVKALSYGLVRCPDRSITFFPIHLPVHLHPSTRKAVADILPGVLQDCIW